MAEHPDYEGFGLREIRQTVVVDFGHPDKHFMFPDLDGIEDFLVGDLFPVTGADGVATWPVVKTHRRDTLAPDGAIERDWSLRVEAVK